VRLAHDVTIDRDPHGVFAYLSEPCNLPGWRPDVVDVTADGARPVTEGFVWQEVRHVLGHRETATMQVTTCEPSRLLSVQTLVAPVPVAMTYRLTDASERTHLRLIVEGHHGRAAWLVGLLGEFALGRDLNSACQRLRDVLQDTAAGPAGAS
jgi:uncharacterized protein YndB with AHSA1/START domain